MGIGHRYRFGAAGSWRRQLRFPLCLGSREVLLEVCYDLCSGVFGQRLAVPMLETLDPDETFPLNRPGEHDRRPAGGPAGGFISCKQIGNAVSIDAQYPPAECFPASFVDFKIPLKHGRLTLTQPIDVDGRAKIVEAVAGRPLRSFPY